MAKFKLDENLPTDAVALLRGAGHDVATVVDQQLGGTPDQDVASALVREKLAFLSLDLDFANIRAFPPANYYGLIVFRLRRLDKRNVLDAISRLLPLFDTNELSGKLWIVDETTVRIRS
jgi:predicted nuclease of predicted toxin-antitoxin system